MKLKFASQKNLNILMLTDGQMEGRTDVGITKAWQLTKNEHSKDSNEHCDWLLTVAVGLVPACNPKANKSDIIEY